MESVKISRGRKTVSKKTVVIFLNLNMSDYIWTKERERKKGLTVNYMTGKFEAAK